MSSESAFRDGLGAGFQLIETMRWEPQGGFLRHGRHLARLKASAQALGFVFDQMSIEQALARSVAGDTALRTRLVLSPDGHADITVQPFVPLPPDVIWSLRIGKTRLDSSNRLLRHKTTNRAAYDAARGEFASNQADEVILLNESGAVCEGTITSVFVDFGDGPLRTPQLSCGLLAGVLRGDLIDRGEAVEAEIPASDLKFAKAIWVGNSLRGLIRTILVHAPV
ncbi:aminotransferase class IV family protein [Aminobacter sp. HY435]|uniref:aminotransferase class IV family protein n=1 Tax=Aminobacter sp. HY435 TaxID=2970917 RepID=UPI0022B9923B|nr:aminotransferase class IV family protein [Aminobacter sp. HY435]